MPSSARLKKIAPRVCGFLLILALPALAQDTLGQGFFTTSDKVKLHYLEAGKGEAILLIPGWLMPADIWQSQIQELSKQYHVVALDPRSQGQSDLTKVGNDPLRRSKDISELLDHLHLDSVVLVGWSLGAYDCLAYLGQFGTDQLKALVLVDSPLAAASAPPTPRGTFLKLFESDRENSNRNYVWGLFKQAPPKGLTKKLTKSAARIPTDIALATLDNTQPGENWAPNPKSLREVPLLYAITPKYAAQAVYLQQVNPQARVETFEQAGHALFVDEPDRFNELIKDFVQKASGSAESFVTAPASPDKSLAKPTTAPNSIPAATPVATSTPLSAAPLSPTPESIIPTVTNKLAVTLLSSPPFSVAASPSPTNSLIPTRTATPGATPSLTTSPEVTPSPTEIEIPARTPMHLTRAISTPLPSFAEKISQTWDALLRRSAKPSQQVTATPRPLPTHVARTQPILEANPVQDGFFTTSDHVKLHYLEAGQGLALVLIPGWLLPAEIWKAQLEGLSDDYHVVALDPRSQGESDMTSKGDEPLRQAKDIQELLDHLHLTAVVLVGWSHGGFHVLAYMGEFGTDRLYATVLVDSALAAASSATSTAPRVRFLEQFKKDRPGATRNFVWSLFKKPPPVDFFHRLVESSMRTPTDIALALMNNAFPGDSWQPSLPTIRQIPLLYAITPKYTTQAAYLQQVDPQARVEIFKDSGHALFVDEPDRFNELIRDFLRQAALYPAGLPHAATHSASGGPVPTHSYLENPK